MEKISWTDRAGNEEVLHRVKEERNMLHTVNRKKANWIGYSWRGKCFLKHVTEGKKEGNSFYILLTVYLEVILDNNQHNALFLNVFISYLYMFRATSAHHQEDQIVLMRHLV